MSVIEPSGAGVVEIGQGALGEFPCSRFIDRQDSVGIASYDLGFTPHKIRRVEPVVAQFVQSRSSCCDRLGTRIGCVIGGGYVGCQAFGEREGFEGCRRGVTRVIRDCQDFRV